MGFVFGGRLGFVAAPALGAEQTCKPRWCCPTCASGIGLEEVQPKSTTGVRTQEGCWGWGWQNVCSETFSLQFRWAGLYSKTKPGSQSSVHVCRDPRVILSLGYLICSEDAPTPRSAELIISQPPELPTGSGTLPPITFLRFSLHLLLGNFAILGKPCPRPRCFFKKSSV